VEEIAQAVVVRDGVLNLLVVCQDITERKRAEEALKKSEQKFAKIFHSVPAQIALTTLAEGRCIDINETCLKILGYQREEVIGRTMLELGVWEERSDRERIVHKLEKQGFVRDLEIRFRSKDGTPFTGLFSAEIVDFDDERYMLSMVNDISERKLMGEEIERLNTDLAARAAELEAANRELEAFNYSVAHDLRKPLTVVNGYCQAIMDLCGNSLDAQCTKYLRETYDGTLRMNRLIDALLSFSRMAHVEPHRESVDLSAMAKEVVEELQHSDPHRRVTVRIAEGIKVSGDPKLLRVVLDNLLGNAWKYTGKREEAVIEFGVAEIGGRPACFVRDNGTGFAMAEAEKLFEPFHRLAGADEFRGHGIGLATVERIIRRHGGQVWAEGEPGKGATFWFTLPGN
jgi:PAS domain S-box-containing protein